MFISSNKKKKKKHDTYIVGLSDLLELSLGLLLVGGVLIGMPLHGELAIGLFEVIIRRAPVYL